MMCKASMTRLEPEIERLLNVSFSILMSWLNEDESCERVDESRQVRVCISHVLVKREELYAS